MSKTRTFLLALVLAPLIAYAANVGLGGPAILVPRVDTADLATCTSDLESLVVYDGTTNTLKLCRNTTGITYAWEEFVEEGSCIADGASSCASVANCCSNPGDVTCTATVCCYPPQDTGDCVTNASCCGSAFHCVSNECCVELGDSGCGSAGDCCNGLASCTGSKCCVGTGGTCVDVDDCCVGGDTCTGNTCTSGGGGGCTETCFGSGFGECTLDPSCSVCPFGGGTCQAF